MQCDESKRWKLVAKALRKRAEETMCHLLTLFAAQQGDDEERKANTVRKLHSIGWRKVLWDWNGIIGTPAPDTLIHISMFLDFICPTMGIMIACFS